MPRITPEELGRLYHEHAPALRLYARQFAAGDEDLIQDAFVLSAWFGRQATAAQSRGQQELAREARAHKAFFLEASHAHHRAFLAHAPAEAVRRALAAMARTRSAA